MNSDIPHSFMNDDMETKKNKHFISRLWAYLCVLKSGINFIRA